MVFTANPEDYTARGKIVTPLKDRIGSEIRTHYPASIALSSRITAAEAFTQRGPELFVPEFIRNVVEAVAFAARRDRRVDKKSGVSQRLAISALENVVSSAERRGIAFTETPVVPRIGDIYASLPAITGKIELEYEGEMAGADAVARDLVREGLKEVFSKQLGSTHFKAVIEHFEQGGSARVSDRAKAETIVSELAKVPSLIDQAKKLAAPRTDMPTLASAAEFILEGLHSQRKIGRSDDKGFVAPERRTEQEVDVEKLERLARLKRQVN
jgi:magnesium chelatase subunit I